MSWPKWMCKLFFCNSAKTMHAKGVLFKSPWQHLKTKHKLRNRIQRYTNAAWFFFFCLPMPVKKIKIKNRCHWKYSERNQRLLVMPIYLHAQHRMHDKNYKDLLYRISLHPTELGNQIFKPIQEQCINASSAKTKLPFRSLFLIGQSTTIFIVEVYFYRSK